MLSSAISLVIISLSATSLSAIVSAFNSESPILFDSLPHEHINIFIKIAVVIIIFFLFIFNTTLYIIFFINIIPLYLLFVNKL